MSDEIFFDGQRFISAAEASSTADLSRDYVARLCRDGKVKGRRIGKNWYVHEDSLKQFLIEQNHAKEIRRGQLSSERTKEYFLAHRVLPPASTDSQPVMPQPLQPTPTEHSIPIRRVECGGVR
ncbi:MAG: helix-turn-helix domain-containing protein, partial [Minisyncoccota bacterium]